MRHIDRQGPDQIFPANETTCPRNVQQQLGTRRWSHWKTSHGSIRRKGDKRILKALRFL